MAGDREEAAEWLRRSAGALPRELGCRRRDGCVGTADRSDEGAPHRRRGGDRRGPVGTRRGRRGGGFADRPLRRRRSLCSSSTGTKRRPRSRQLSARAFQATSQTRSRRSPATTWLGTAWPSPRCVARSRSRMRSSRTFRSPTPRSRSTCSRRGVGSARASQPLRGRESPASFPPPHARGCPASRVTACPRTRARLPRPCPRRRRGRGARACCRGVATSCEMRSTKGSCPASEPTTSRLGYVERGEVREERGDMAVRAEPEQHEIEGADVRQLVPVLRPPSSRPSSPCIRWTAAGAPSSRSRQRRLRHPVVRALVAGRHAALVSPPELDLAPVGLELGGDLEGVAAGSSRR